MKRTLSFVMSIVMVMGVLLCAPLTIDAQAADISALTFELNGDIGTYKVTECHEDAVGHITVPATYKGIKVTSIDSYAFHWCGKITSVTIENGIESIGEYAFADCAGLTSVEIPDSVTNIGELAFAGCKALVSVRMSQNLSAISKEMFYGCDALMEIEIPESVTSIGEAAFVWCGNLYSVVIPGSVTSIGNGAFSECTSLSDVKIEHGVKIIGEYTFEKCYNLDSIEIPDSLRSIGYKAFEFCESLTSITIPEGVTTIGERAFAWSGIQKIVLPSTLKKIERETFFYCGSLYSVTIPDSVTSIGDYAFEYCNKLSSITIPDSVTSLGNGAFIGCSQLSDVKLSNQLTSIGSDTFESCRSLVSIVIPDNVISIGEDAFGWCSSLESMVLPVNLKSIVNNAFWYCDSFKYVFYKGTEEQKASMFLGDNEVLINAAWHYNATDHTVVADKAVAPTCTKAGKTAGSHCSVCNAVIKAQKTVAAKGHTAVTDKAVAATCTKAGKTAGSHCSVCNAVIKAQKTVAAKGHTYKNTITKATLTSNGKSVPKCTVCGYVSKTTVIYYPKTIKLSATSYTYDGNVKTPSVTVKDSNGKALVKGTDYKVTVPSGRKLPGVYTYTITFMGKYSGTKTLTFKILPATVNAAKMTATATTSSIKLTWGKVTGATGYKVYQYSSSQGKYVQIATVTGNTYNKTGLKAGTTYQFKVKAYKKLSNGTVIEGAASSAFSTATKCAAPKISSLVASSGQKATLKWSAVTGATGYQVYYSTKKDSGYQKAVSTTSKTASKTFSKSTKGKKIYFKVRAYKKVNGQTIYGNWSAVKSVKLK